MHKIWQTLAWVFALTMNNLIHPQILFNIICSRISMKIYIDTQQPL